MQRKLAFEQTPPLSIPLRFFLTAPVFALLAGVLLLWQGPDAVVSRWSPLTLALTHLLTLGFLTMIMIGAMMQLLQVVAGINLPKLNLTAGIVHSGLTLGTISLASAFLLPWPDLFYIALLFLGGAFTWLFGACLIGMWRVTSDNVTFRVMRLALAALAVTVTLGSSAVLSITGHVALPLIQLTNLHMTWGLLGWTGLLVIAVAFQVVPMFMVTPQYPRAITGHAGKALFSLFMLWTVVTMTSPEKGNWSAPGLAVLMATGLAIFALITLRLLWQRKRKIPDITVMFWHVGAGSLLACCVIWAAGALHPPLADQPCFALLLGTLFVIGFAYSVINGMLYKIVPFLIWYHLQTHFTELGMKAPGIRQIVPEHVARWQFYAHLVALALLILAAIGPDYFARLAAVGFIVSTLWLWVNLLRAVFFYRTNIIITGSPVPSFAVQ